MRLEQLASARRRFWVTTTLVAATVLYSWASVNRLSQLVDVQALDEDVGRHSLLELAEQNIASHLHLPARHGGEAFRGGLSAHDSGSSDMRGGGGGGSTSATTSATSSTSKPKPDASKDKSAKAKAAAGCTGRCHTMPNTDFWGDALVWGSNNFADSADECCAQCEAYKPGSSKDSAPCNVWVFCGDAKLCGSHHRECWLKHLAHPLAAGPAKEGPDVGWTTGLMVSPEQVKQAKNPSHTGGDRRYHVIISAQGSAVHWQSRVHYYWYKKIKKQCEDAGPCDMGGFTRLLHSGEPDDLMNEIPTFVAQPLPPDKASSYVVLNRPWAFVQWAQKADIPEKYVLMSEPDHVWLKPMPNFMVGDTPAAFPFFYIEPSKKENLPIVAKFVGPVSREEAEEIAPIGNAPTIMSLEDMKKVFPLWMNISLGIHNDADATKAWGWVQEMYAFTLACYGTGIRGISLHKEMMAQPPWDTVLERFYILHYTYGMDYTLDGEFTPGKFGEWRFDKRSYSSKPPPRKLGEPPAGMKNELVRHLIHAINEASEAIPDWDSYSNTGHAAKLWDGKV